jgi:hypothetical protein
MSAIRPYQPPAAPPARREPARAPITPTPAVRTAQQAFFRTASDQPAAPAQPPLRRVEPTAVDRLPRPGSLLDIKV